MLFYLWEPWITNVDGFNTASKHSQTTKYEVVKLNWKVQVQESRDCLIGKAKSANREPRTHMFTRNWELGTSSYPYKLQVTSYRVSKMHISKS